MNSVRIRFVCRLLLGLGLMPLAGGCALMGPWVSNGWLSDYEAAEQKAAGAGQPVLLVYKDTHFGLENTTERSLMDPNVRRRTDDFVRCCLFREYERDRRYAAQFGVYRTPALIVVRPDGTFHARTGALEPVELVDFLMDTEQTGLAYAPDPCLPRRVGYKWCASVQEARICGVRRDVPVLHVLHRTLTNDWRELQELLHRPEVHRRLKDLVHCRTSSWQWGAAEIGRRLEAREWPAIVIEHPDGKISTLQGPQTYEQVVRFADQSLGRAPESERQESIAGAAADVQ